MIFFSWKPITTKRLWVEEIQRTTRSISKRYVTVYWPSELKPKLAVMGSEPPVGLHAEARAACPGLSVPRALYNKGKWADKGEVSLRSSFLRSLVDLPASPFVQSGGSASEPCCSVPTPFEDMLCDDRSQMGYAVTGKRCWVAQVLLEAEYTISWSEDEWAGKSRCYQAWLPELDSWTYTVGERANS